MYFFEGVYLANRINTLNSEGSCIYLCVYTFSKQIQMFEKFIEVGSVEKLTKAVNILYLQI